MRIFLAGASGVIGSRLIPLFREAGHEIAGMTRSAEKAEMLELLGAEPMVCDVFDADALHDAVVSFQPDAVVHQLTDLPDESERISGFLGANARIRREGTRNLIEAARAAGARRLLVQSIAWEPPGDSGGAVAELERMTLDAGGVVLRYGQLYGRGTYHENEPPPPPRIHVDVAARRTVEVLEAAPGVLELVES